MEASLAFYAGLLGFEVLSDRVVALPSVQRITGVVDAKIRVCMLRIPKSDVYLELLDYVKGKTNASGSRSPASPGSTHICLYVDDLRTTWARLSRAGVVGISEPIDFSDRIPGTWCMYIRDPDGCVVELYEGPRYVARPSTQ